MPSLPISTRRAAVVACAAIALGAAAEALPAGADASSGRFFAVRHVEQHRGEGAVFEERRWRAADGAGHRQWLRDGRVVSDTPLAANARDNELELLHEDVLALPAEPDALLARLRELAMRPQPVLDPGTGKPTGRTLAVPPEHADRETLLAAVAVLDWDRPLPERLRRALISAMARTPGVRRVGVVRDPLGRRGVGFALDGDEAHEGYGRQVIVDPRRAELLATVDYRDGDLDRVASTWTRRQAVVDSADRTAR